MKNKSVREEYESALFGSDCSVDIKINKNFELEKITINFFGELSKIPSLKNSKIPGKNFIANRTQGKLKAMTTLFSHRAKGSWPTKLTEDLYVHVVLSKKSRVDEDNAFAAIRDWLEPPFKNNRDWGIGLVLDDKQICGGAYHAKRINYNCDHTSITILPLIDVQEALIEFHEKIVGENVFQTRLKNSFDGDQKIFSP